MNVFRRFRGKISAENDIQGSTAKPDNAKKVIIAGTPNVGKSVLFNALTGMYATVSNYPGTSVEVSRGQSKIIDQLYEIIDTPGMYSLSNITEEERVTKSIIFTEKVDLLIHVVDAKNLERMLPLTFQLMEIGLPMLLVLNIMDEARKEGVRVDIPALAKTLGIPVIGAEFTAGQGIQEVRSWIAGKLQASGTFAVQYPELIENAISQIEHRIDFSSSISRRTVSLMLLKEDPDLLSRIVDPENLNVVNMVVTHLKNQLHHPLIYELAVSHSAVAAKICSRIVTLEPRKLSLGKQIGDLTLNPWTGVPILLLVLYFGLYKFVGVFGAGTVVNYIEGDLFSKHLNPWLIYWVNHWVPWRLLRDLLVSDYGLLTLGLRYALAIVLPIVGFFFVVFSIIEDSGYLPRLAMLIDRVFKRIGLSGRAVIPMVLGFGCTTMATMVTRTLPTRRERLIATMLLALAVPCSAQFGVILALLSHKPLALLLWCVVVGLIFLLIGYLSAQILPGDRPSFYMELPPLRWPKLTNVALKTYMRMKWYLYEIIPLFLLASILIWVGTITGLFDLLVHVLVRPVQWIGLPAAAAKIFLYGFFRRDYGAAGLYDMYKAGVLSGVQILVASVALTLFLPCIAQFIMNIKERGLKVGIYISLFVLVMSFSVAFILNYILTSFGVVI